MKKAKIDATNLTQLNDDEMRKINGGGYWAVITTPDGKTITVWVEP